MDLVSVADPEGLIGKSLLFRVTQLRRGGEDVVVSHRAVLEEEQREEAKAVRATLIEGSVMQGRVSGIASFGAFIDLGAGVRGLVHLSELAHTRIDTADQAVKVGEKIDVRVLKIDEQSGRISLSLRQAVADPWNDVEERFQINGVYPGKVGRLADFGAFVELAPGIEALAPASEFAPSREGWRAGLELGATRDWLVLSVDSRQRRIAVTPPVEGQDPSAGEPLRPGMTLRGAVQRVERFGVFVWLGPGRVGLMPSKLSGTRPGTDLSRSFPVAEELEVEVVEIAEGGKRIRLAKKGVRAAEKPSREGEERQARPKAKRDEPISQEPEGAFGSLLADKLKVALDPSRDRT